MLLFYFETLITINTMMNGYRVAGFHVYRGASREEDHALNQNVYAQAAAAFLSALPV